MLLCSFVSLIVTEAMPLEQIASDIQESTPVFKVKAYGKKISPAQKKNFEQIIAEGRRLLQDEMDYEGAIIQFKEAGTLAVTQPQKSDAYFYLSLAYYATISERGEADFKETVRRLIEVDYYRELDMRLCPPNYIDIFQGIKAEYGVLRVQSRPPEAEVYIDNKEESSGKTPLTIGIREGSIAVKVKKESKEREDTLEVTAGQRTTSPIYVLKGKSSLLFVLGGIALAAGVGAVLFTGKKKNGGGTPSGPTTGSIQVNSTPSGANIFLDGTDTEQTTNATLTNVSPGSHTVKLTKEGYEDHEVTVSVTSGETTIMNAILVEIVVGTEYEFIAKWGSWGTGDGQIRQPSGIAVDNSGYVYVVDTVVNHRIHKFTSSGTFVTKWGSEGSGDGQFSWPWGIAVDRSGFVYVTDERNSRIQKFTSSGSFVTKWGSNGDGDGQFVWPAGIAVDNSDYVYVADQIDDHIQKFTSSGTFVTKWGSYGSGDGQLSMPLGIAVANSGHVYIVDYFNSRIQKFTSSGTFVTKWGSNGSGDGQFNNPWGIAVDNSGYVYVSDSDNYRIQKFTSSGSFVTKWGSYGSGDGQFNNPKGLAVDNSGYVYVSDSDNHRIQKFGPVSSAVKTFKSSPNLIRNNFLKKNIAPLPRNLNLPRRDNSERKIDLTQRKDRKQKKKK